MNEWWTYRPGDFLMFSPRVYARLFELLNEAWWPLHLLLLPAGMLGLVALRRPRSGHAVALGAGLAAAWLFCIGVFLHARYLPINWAVGYLLPALLLLAALLPLLAWRARGGVPAGATARRVALALGAWALLLHPLLAPWAGRPWQQAEVIALAPDPTAIATLAFLLALPRLPTPAWRGLAVLAWLLVLAWCAFSALLLATMERWNAGVLVLAAVLALLSCRGRYRS